MAAFTSFRYLLLDLRICIGTNYCVSCLSSISAMYALGSWLGPSDEIRLYANNMQRIYTEYGSKVRSEPTEATGIYTFVFIS